MGVLDWFRPKASIDVAKIETSAELAELFNIHDYGNAFSGEEVSVRTAQRVAAVYRCVEILSELAATAPVKIVNRDTLEARPPDNDLIWRLNGMANDRMSAYELRKMMERHRLLTGNGYARIIRGAGNRPIALEFMHSGAVKVRELENRTLEYTWAPTQGGLSIVLPESDVLHIRGPSDRGIIGQSVIEAARNQVGFSIASEKHASSLFKNGTNIADVLETDQKLSPEGIAALKTSLDSFRGADNGHKTLVLQDGLEYQKIGMSQVDAEFVNSRKLGIIEICMFFGVPPHIVGYTENQTSYGQGVEHQGIAFTNFRVGPLFASWEAAILSSLLRGNRREMVEFEESKLMRGDVKSRWEAHKIAREIGAMSANDILRAEGRPERAGGDDYWSQPNLASGDSNDTDSDTGTERSG